MNAKEGYTVGGVARAIQTGEPQICRVSRELNAPVKLIEGKFITVDDALRIQDVIIEKRINGWETTHERS